MKRKHGRNMTWQSLICVLFAGNVKLNEIKQTKKKKKNNNKGYFCFLSKYMIYFMSAYGTKTLYFHECLLNHIVRNKNVVFILYLIFNVLFMDTQNISNLSRLLDFRR